MPADLENDMKDLGARLLAEAPPVTTDEVVQYTAERSRSSTTIDPLITDVPLVSDIRSPRDSPRRRYALVGTIAAASMLVVGLGVANRAGDSEPTAVGSASTVAPTTLEAAPGPTTVAPGAVAPTSAATASEVGGTVAWPPRVLIDETWGIVDANERSANEGYVMFERDGMSTFVGWYRGQLHGDDWYADQGFTEAGTATMLGQSVTVYASPPMFATDDIRQLLESGQLASDIVADDLASLDESLASLPEGEANFGDYIGGPTLEEELAEAIDAGLIESVSDSLEAQVVWDQTSLNVQIRPRETGAEPTMDDLVAVLGALHEVESPEWEAALPDNIVPFSERPAVITEMTTELPLPANFTVDYLGDQELVQSRGAIADEVVKSVACAWLNQYFTATDGNNPDAAQEALDAIGSIPDWPVAQELQTAMDAATPESGVIRIPNSGLTSLSVTADGTIMNEGTGEVLTNDFAVNLCYVDAVG